MAGPVVAAASSLGMVQLNLARKVVSLHQGRHLSTTQQTEKIEVCSIFWNLSGVNFDWLAAERTAHFDYFFHEKLKFLTIPLCGFEHFGTFRAEKRSSIEVQTAVNHGVPKVNLQFLPTSPAAGKSVGIVDISAFSATFHVKQCSFPTF